MTVPERIGCLMKGLAIVQSRVIGFSFYNSSGDTAYFHLASPLTDDEEARVLALGFGYYWQDNPDGSGNGSVSFSENDD